MYKTYNINYIYLILIFVSIILAILVVTYSDRLERFLEEFLRRLFQILFHSHPIILLSFLIVFSILLIFLAKVGLPSKEIKEYEVAQQIEKLDEMQNSLEDLQNLISTQKEKLISTEKYIELLKMEKQKLEPVVKANRELVESILTLQKERTIAQIWKDRFVGFIISLLAGLIIIIFSKFTNKEIKKNYLKE